jgi:hypothetical protein
MIRAVNMGPDVFSMVTCAVPSIDRAAGPLSDVGGMVTSSAVGVGATVLEVSLLAVGNSRDTVGLAVLGVTAGNVGWGVGTRVLGVSF